ncbi:hypothetical protein ACHQM5_015454 [Ranunculus cassubicifolius]
MAMKQQNPWMYLLSLAMTDLCNIQQGTSKPCDPISLPKDFNVPIEYNIGARIKSRNSKKNEKRSMPKPLSTNQNSKVKKKGGKKVQEIFQESPMPAMYREKIEAMGGKDVRWIIKKEITPTDVNKTQCRYYLPKHAVEILTPREFQYIKRETTNEIEVKVIDRENRVQELSVRYWPSIRRASLVKNWIPFARDNNIRAGQYAEVWSFRIPDAQNGSDQLCFVLNTTTE